MIMVDATKEKYRFQIMHTTASPQLSLGAIKCFPREGPFKMTLEGQVKTQPEKNCGQLRKGPDGRRVSELRS